VTGLQAGLLKNESEQGKEIFFFFKTLALLWDLPAFYPV
jgi:hypothetical protein